MWSTAGAGRRKQAKGVERKKGASGLFRATTHCKARLGGGSCRQPSRRHVGSKLDNFQPRIGQVGDSGGPISLWQLRAQPFQGVSHGSPIIVNHKCWVWSTRKLGPSNAGAPLSTFLAATAFRNFRQPSSASLVVETDHRDPLTHHSAYGFPQVENFFLPLRDSRPQPRPDATLRITAP